MKTNSIPACNKCHIPMKTGLALQNTLSGLPDFPGDKTCCTLSRTGPPEMVAVWKCPKCGRSFEKK